MTVAEARATRSVTRHQRIPHRGHGCRNESASEQDLGARRRAHIAPGQLLLPCRRRRGKASAACRRPRPTPPAERLLGRCPPRTASYDSQPRTTLAGCCGEWVRTKSVRGMQLARGADRHGCVAYHHNHACPVAPRAAGEVSRRGMGAHVAHGGVRRGKGSLVSVRGSRRTRSRAPVVLRRRGRPGSAGALPFRIHRQRQDVVDAPNRLQLGHWQASRSGHTHEAPVRQTGCPFQRRRRLREGARLGG